MILNLIKRSVKNMQIGLWASILVMSVLSFVPSKSWASGAYVDPTKLKKKAGDQASGNAGASASGGKGSELSEVEEEAARAQKKEALKKALLKGK